MTQEPKPKPVTIYELACHRLNMPNADSLNGADFDRARLPMLGGCEVCGATVAAYNACPSKTGYLRCANGCIEDLGWEDVEQCDRDIFEDES